MWIWRLGLTMVCLYLLHTAWIYKLECVLKKCLDYRWLIAININMQLLLTLAWRVMYLLSGLKMDKACKQTDLYIRSDFISYVYSIWAHLIKTVTRGCLSGRYNWNCNLLIGLSCKIRLEKYNWYKFRCSFRIWGCFVICHPGAVLAEKPFLLYQPKHDNDPYHHTEMVWWTQSHWRPVTILVSVFQTVWEGLKKDQNVKTVCPVCKFITKFKLTV